MQRSQLRNMFLKYKLEEFEKYIKFIEIFRIDS